VCRRSVPGASRFQHEDAVGFLQGLNGCPQPSRNRILHACQRRRRREMLRRCALGVHTENLLREDLDDRVRKECDVVAAVALAKQSKTCESAEGVHCALL